MIEVRPASAEEMGALGTLTGYVYGGAFGDGPESLSATANRPEWTLCAFDGGRMAASFATIPFTMRVNGNAMALGGVSAVATHPSYRRQGLMRRLMTEATSTMRDHGQSIAALWASQAAIYQRFGYSIGSHNRSYTIDSADIGFHDGLTGTYDVDLHDLQSGFDEARSLYIAFIAGRTGYLHRSRALWANGVLDAGVDAGPVHIAVARNAQGEAKGHLAYTLRANRVDHRARAQELVIRDLVWLDLDAYRSLWSYLSLHDLVGRVVWPNAPSDDPADELFTEPRMLHASNTEGVWFRVIDAEPALLARGYSGPAQATITIAADPLSPWNAGTYTIETDGTETLVNRTLSPATSGPVTSIKGFSSLFSGMRSARHLRSAGLLEGPDADIASLDDLFATHHAPHSPDHF